MEYNKTRCRQDNHVNSQPAKPAALR